MILTCQSVLNPNNTGNGTINESTTTPAFSGATPVTDGGIPFTSNVPSPTQTASNLITSSSKQAGVPQATAAVAFGALLGGAAVMMNM